VNSKRHSGLAQRKAVDVAPAADGKGVLLSVKQPKKLYKPNQATKTVTLKRKEMRTVRNSASAIGKGQFAKAAQRRAAVILRSQRPKSSKKTKVEA